MTKIKTNWILSKTKINLNVSRWFTNSLARFEPWNIQQISMGCHHLIRGTGPWNKLKCLDGTPRSFVNGSYCWKSLIAARPHGASLHSVALCLLLRDDVPNIFLMLHGTVVIFDHDYSAILVCWRRNGRINGKLVIHQLKIYLNELSIVVQVWNGI